MLGFVLVCGLIASASAGYSSSGAGAGAGAGLYNSYSNDNYGGKYPYSNQYSGYNNYGGSSFPFYQPFAPLPPIPSPWDYQNAFNQYFSSVNQNIANQFNAQLAQQAAFFNAVRNQAQGNWAGAGGGSYAGTGGHAGTGGYTGTGTGGYGPGYSNYASSGGAVGPNGVYQHASIYPQNPANPNVDVYQRFGDNNGPTVSHSSGPGGYVGISSFSSSSDINGVKQRESATSVNKDGKVTTYHVRN